MAASRRHAGRRVRIRRDRASWRDSKGGIVALASGRAAPRNDPAPYRRKPYRRNAAPQEKNVDHSGQIALYRKLKLANRARLDLFPPGVFVWCLMRTPPRACSRLLLVLFRLVVA